MLGVVAFSFDTQEKSNVAGNVDRAIGFIQQL